MIKLIIFDLDGVLVDTKDIHYEALNLALKKVNKKYFIDYNSHINEFDGLSTLNKLEKLHEKRKLPKNKFKLIKKNKDLLTKKLIKEKINYKKTIEVIFKDLSKKYKIAVASNAIADTIITCLKILKIKNYVDLIISNEDVSFIKPNPQIFLKCMVKFGISPNQTLILEDSAKGRQAAINSGAHLMAIEKLEDVKKTKIVENIKSIGHKLFMKKKEYWSSNNLNVLIPMAGLGSRFKEKGYTYPKPLIEINGKPMIQVVVENLAIDANFIFIVQKEHREKYNLDSMLKLITNKCQIVETSELTEGAACTTLLAKKFINNNSQLLIANSDQFIEWDPLKVMYNFTSQKVDGGILTFKATHPRWSFAKINKNNIVSEVAEKKPISDNATVGVYFWNKGSEYVKYAEQMIKKNIRTNNEFYVCPVYNEAIADNKIIRSFEISKMWGLGTPEDLDTFLQIKK